MTDANRSANLVANIVLAEPSAEKRDQVARDFLGYSLGALAALNGKQYAAEVAYRFADAMVSLKTEADA